jgi:hypothetical protein
MDLTKYKVMFYIYFRRSQMNPYTQMLEHSQEQLKTLRHQAEIAQLQPKQPSLRRRLARVLKNLANQLEQEPKLAHP